MTTLKDQKLTQVQLDATGTQVQTVTDWFASNWGRLRDVLEGPDGEIYIATNGYSYVNAQPFTHQIIRLRNANPLLSIQQIDEKHAYRVYPNPTYNSLTIDGLSESENTIEIYSLIGEQLYSNTTTGTTQQLSLKELPSGTYLLRVNKQYTQKISIR